MAAVCLIDILNLWLKVVKADAAFVTMIAFQSLLGHLS
jgi:hypothetical protein